MKRCYSIYLLIILLAGCSFKKNSADMRQVLLEKARESFFVPENPYASRVLIYYYDSVLQLANPLEKNLYKYRLAEALLYGGKTQEAIQHLQELQHLKNTSRFVQGLEDHQEDQLDALLALAYLRLGEQQNCIINHTSASCIIPVHASGVHRLQEGSRKAIELLEKILKDNPRDLHSLWLLNVAYMTLGEYPENVPDEWLIPEEALQSDYDLKRFKDIAPQLGLDINGLSGGVVVDDFTNDG